VSYALALLPAVAGMLYAESHVAALSALRQALLVENFENIRIDGVLLLAIDGFERWSTTESSSIARF
jgi:hypothetical protein